MKTILALILAALLALAPTFALAETAIETADVIEAAADAAGSADAESAEPLEYEFVDDYELTEDGIIINIQDNPTTGYEWQCARYDETMLELVSDEFVANPNPDLMGAPGVHKFTFKLVGQEGDANIRFAQRHVGDDAINAALYYIIEAAMGKIAEVTTHEVKPDDEIEFTGEETGNVRLTIPSSLFTHREDNADGIYLISDDESTRIHIQYNAADDPEAVLAQFADKDANAAQYDLEDRSMYVMYAERLTDNDGVPYAALTLNTPEGFRLAEAFQAPAGGVLYVTTDYTTDYGDN